MSQPCLIMAVFIVSVQ